MSIEKQRLKCRKKFLYYFRGGFYGEKYISWERDYKWQAHLSWTEMLNKKTFTHLLSENKFDEIAARAVRIESRTNLLFSFEKMALRDAVKNGNGAQQFSEGLFTLIYGKLSLQSRFENFRNILATLPRKQTRVLTWPLQTVFGFIGDPETHIFLKPRVTMAAAEKYGFPFQYKSGPSWETYKSYLDFAAQIKKDIADLKPRDMIDIQSFMWVLGSEEYPD